MLCNFPTAVVVVLSKKNKSTQVMLTVTVGLRGAEVSLLLTS